jgi:Fe-S-cluster containining protein
MKKVASCHSELVQVVDLALSEAARKSSGWIACRPGCGECCIGTFAINQLDAHRLQDGFRALQETDKAKAKRIERRVLEYCETLSEESSFGATACSSTDGNACGPSVASLADDHVCPALDPISQTCDLYESRPMECRLYGPALRDHAGIVSTCHLCYDGATEEQISACVVDIGYVEEVEAKALSALEVQPVGQGMTSVGLCLGELFE